MVLETFLLFISTLMSLNASSNSNQTQPNHATEIHKTHIKSQNPNADASRGGWDHN